MNLRLIVKVVSHKNISTRNQTILEKFHHFVSKSKDPDQRIHKPGIDLKLTL